MHYTTGSTFLHVSGMKPKVVLPCLLPEVQVTPTGDQLGHTVLPYFQIDYRLMHGSEKGWCFFWSALTQCLRTKKRRVPRFPSLIKIVLQVPISGHWFMFLAFGEKSLCPTTELSPFTEYLMSCVLDFV